jgi:hypothetical protein
MGLFDTQCRSTERWYHSYSDIVVGCSRAMSCASQVEGESAREEFVRRKEKCSAKEVRRRVPAQRIRLAPNCREEHVVGAAHAA